MKVFKTIVKALPFVLKTRRVVKESRELGEDVIKLRNEVERVLEKWEHLPEVMGYDVKQLIYRLDNVTESAADIAGELGAKGTETALRGFVKEELYR